MDSVNRLKIKAELLAQAASNVDTNSTYYRGTKDLKEVIAACKTGSLPFYSNDPIPKDVEALEMSGIEVENLPENKRDALVSEYVPWTPFDKGVNLSADLEYAKTYGDYVMTVEVAGAFVDFSEFFVFAKEPSECKVVSVIFKDKEYSPQDFLKKFSKKAELLAQASLKTAMPHYDTAKFPIDLYFEHFSNEDRINLIADILSGDDVMVPKVYRNGEITDYVVVNREVLDDHLANIERQQIWYEDVPDGSGELVYDSQARKVFEKAVAQVMATLKTAGSKNFRGWVSPEGVETDVPYGDHYSWAFNNVIKGTNNDIDRIMAGMFDLGWARVTADGGQVGLSFGEVTADAFNKAMDLCKEGIDSGEADNVEVDYWRGKVREGGAATNVVEFGRLRNKFSKLLGFTTASITLDIEKGDEILRGKWQNQKEIVKTISKDQYGNPVINGNIPIMKIRVPKLYKKSAMEAIMAALEDDLPEDPSLEEHLKYGEPDFDPATPRSVQVDEEMLRLADPYAKRFKEYLDSKDVPLESHWSAFHKWCAGQKLNEQWRIYIKRVLASDYGIKF